MLIDARKTKITKEMLMEYGETTQLSAMEIRTFFAFLQRMRGAWGTHKETEKKKSRKTCVNKHFFSVKWLEVIAQAW